MEKKIIQYSLLKTLYDKTGNILECFYPFFLKCLPDDNFIDSLKCQQDIKSKFDLEIPIHVLQRLAHIAEQNKHIITSNEKSLWPIKLTELGTEQIDKIVNQEDIERKINQLVTGFSDYLKTTGISINFEKVRKIIEHYINKNLLHLSDFFFEHTDPFNECFEDHEKEFTKFILLIEEKNPEEYRTLKEMFYGSIISSSLKLPQPEFDGVINSKFKKTKIYFDANYLFSLLEYHDEELSIPANELYKMFIKYGFELRYYDFTLSEMTHVLSNFIKNYNTYPSSIRIKSLYSVLKRKKMKPSDIIDLISNLELKLERLKIYKKNTGIDLENYVPEDESISRRLREMKPEQSEFYHTHDLALLEKSKNLRKKRTHNFEDANSFIVTSDFKLGLLCYRIFNHGNDRSISEIILDRTFTNILFLKDPSIELSLSTIISGFSSELFVKRSVWEKFHSLLRGLKESGEITDDKISNLFYHGYIENELINCESSNIDSIDETFVLEKIEEATELKEKDVKDKIDEIISQSELIIESKEEEKKRAIESKDFDLKLKIDKKAKKESVFIQWGIRIIFFLLLIAPLIIEISRFCSTKKISTSVFSIIRYILYVFTTCFISIQKIWECIGEKVYNYRKNKYEKDFLS